MKRFIFLDRGKDMGKATIKDVSELTGLATGTISKYLNGGKLKEANRVKVEEAIEKLGYQVDEYARGLITHRTKTVGILLPELDNAFMRRSSPKSRKTSTAAAMSPWCGIAAGIMRGNCRASAGSFPGGWMPSSWSRAPTALPIMKCSKTQVCRSCSWICLSKGWIFNM